MVCHLFWVVPKVIYGRVELTQVYLRLELFNESGAIQLMNLQSQIDDNFQVDFGINPSKEHLREQVQFGSRITQWNKSIAQKDEAWKFYDSSLKIAWKTGTSFGNRDAWAIGTTRVW
jgi:penicillin-binding protein 1C